MGIEVIEESKKRPIGPTPAQPVEEGFVGPVCTARLETDPFDVVIEATIENVLEEPVPGHRTADERPGRQREILEMGESAGQPCFKVAAVGIRRKPGGLIAPTRQELRQSRARSVEREFPLRIELEWPLAGEEAGMRGIRPWRGRQSEVVLDAPSPIAPGWEWCSASSRRRSGRSAHCIPDDEHDVSGSRGW